MSENKTFMVNSVSVTHYRYLVEAESEQEALEWVHRDPPGIKEFTARHVAENVLSADRIDIATDESFNELLEKHRADSSWWMGRDLVNEALPPGVDDDSDEDLWDSLDDD